MAGKAPELAFNTRHGLPHPQWAKLKEQVLTIDDVNTQRDAWRSAAEAWLTKLAEAISEDTVVFASSRVLLVGSSDAKPLITFAEKTIDQIDRLLSGVGSIDRCGPHVIIVFDSPERYYDYIDYFHTENRDYGGSGGMFIDSDYTHIVIGPGSQFQRSTIAHELTHDYLAKRDLPRWLEEGLAQLIESHAASIILFAIDRELQQRQQTHWSAASLETFWSGEAFSAPGESQELAYKLAFVLIQNIITDAGELTAAFVREAHCSDAGEAAALTVLGHSLADYVSAFLGPGDWVPRPPER